LASRTGIRSGESVYTEAGPEPKNNPLAGENERLRQQNKQLEEELRKAELVIEIQKKVAMLLGQPLALLPEDENS